MVTDKVSLRWFIKRKCSAIRPESRKNKSTSITEKLVHTAAFQSARKICCYVSFGHEVSTRDFIRSALKARKDVYVPRLDRGADRIGIYLIRNHRKDLACGTYGIREPRPIASRKGRIRDMDLVIVPGLAFTRKGARLGRGGGHFDRLLCRARGVRKIGLAYREQILKKIPVNKHDIFMDQVITD